MSLGSSTESHPAFARIGLRKNPGKNLNQVTCPDRDSNPGHLVSRLDVLTVTPQQATKGNIEGGGFGPVLWIEFGVAQWSERLVRRTKDTGFIPNALLTFKSKSTKDYHEEMDSTVFKNWFINQLLPNIPLNSIISALAKVTEDNWRKACEHVEKVDQFYWEKDGLVDEISDRFVINLDDTDTDEELSGGEESEFEEEESAAAANSWSLEGVSTIPPSP
ncbi:hypothetical protein ANN_12524 [Periplaneta americana]|uniref:Uncharacterized protein n=1 Tax=Periplaneta americana TaxID=6978 RepID=A0ABQ8TGW1_PERAM|nr:hypothetical protein ANN_12524 [Periplaneta americana]